MIPRRDSYLKRTSTKDQMQVDMGGSRTDEFTDRITERLERDSLIGVGKGPLAHYHEDGHFFGQRSIFLLTVDDSQYVPDDTLVQMANGLHVPCWRIDFSDFPLIHREFIAGPAGSVGALDTLTIQELTTEVVRLMEASPMKSENKFRWDAEAQSDGTRSHPIVPCTEDTPLRRRMSVWQMAIDSGRSKAVDLDLVAFARKTSQVFAIVETKKMNATEETWAVTKQCADWLHAESAILWYHPDRIDDDLVEDTFPIIHASPAYMQVHQKRKHWEPLELDDHGDPLKVGARRSTVSSRCCE